MIPFTFTAADGTVYGGTCSGFRSKPGKNADGELHVGNPSIEVPSDLVGVWQFHFPNATVTSEFAKP